MTKTTTDSHYTRLTLTHFSTLLLLLRRREKWSNRYRSHCLYLWEFMCLSLLLSMSHKGLIVILKTYLLSHHSLDSGSRSPRSPHSPPPPGPLIAARPGQPRSPVPLCGWTVRLCSAPRAGETHSRALLWSGNRAWVSARSPSQRVNRRKTGRSVSGE